MDHLVVNIVRHIVQLIVTAYVFGSIVLAGALIIPATRAALGRWLRIRITGEIDQGDVLAQLGTANAQIATLQEQLYALRSQAVGIAAPNPTPKPVNPSPENRPDGDS